MVFTKRIKSPKLLHTDHLHYTIFEMDELQKFLPILQLKTIYFNKKVKIKI